MNILETPQCCKGIKDTENIDGADSFIYVKDEDITFMGMMTSILWKYPSGEYLFIILKRHTL